MLFLDNYLKKIFFIKYIIELNQSEFNNNIYHIKLN